jgi:hypothetical protein
VKAVPLVHFGEMSMFGIRRLSAIIVVLFGAAVVLPLPAGAVELTGAWASQADLCKLVFTKKGNEVVFTEFSDVYGSGFIIDGNRIRAKAARCTINSRKQNGDTLELKASCASSVATQSATFILKVIDDNNIARIIPEIDNSQIKYTRCSF